jgi:hypothetical protein
MCATESPALQQVLIQQPTSRGEVAVARCAAAARTRGAMAAGAMPRVQAICLGDLPWSRSWCTCCRSSGLSMGGHRIQATSRAGRSAVTATVAGMAVDDARGMIAALAQPEALLVFGAIVAATSRARPLDEMGNPLVGTSSPVRQRVEVSEHVVLCGHRSACRHRSIDSSGHAVRGTAGTVSWPSPLTRQGPLDWHDTRP